MFRVRLRQRTVWAGLCVCRGVPQLGLCSASGISLGPVPACLWAGRCQASRGCLGHTHDSISSAQIRGRSLAGKCPRFTGFCLLTLMSIQWLSGPVVLKSEIILACMFFFSCGRKSACMLLKHRLNSLREIVIFLFLFFSAGSLRWLHGEFTTWFLSWYWAVLLCR